MPKIKTMKEWASREGRAANKRRGDAFEKKIAAELGGAGYAVDVVEISRQMIVRRGRAAWITKKADFFGCIDLIAVRPGDPVLFIQATLDDSPSMFKRKAAEIEKIFVSKSDGRRVIIVQPHQPKLDDIDDLAAGVRYSVRELIYPGHWSRALLASVETDFGAAES